MGLSSQEPARGGMLCHWTQSHGVSILSVVVGVVLWQFLAGQLPDLILPAPSAIIERFLDPIWTIELLRALAGSLVHLAIGFGLCLATALPLGILIGRSKLLSSMFEPLISALYAIPPVAFVPFLVIWFGLFLEARIALVVLMSFFDVLVVIIAGARDVRPSFISVGHSFGASYFQLFRLVVLPALLPFFFGALRVGSARSINAMITAELFFAAVNLGGIMKQASQNFDSATVLSVVLLICLLGLMSQSVINILEARLLRWHIRS